MFGLNSHGQAQFNDKVVWVVLSGVSVAIRLFCKIKNKQGIKSDDYWVLAALAFYYAAVAFSIWGIITGGGGLEMEQIIMLIEKNPNNVNVLSNYLESLFLSYTFVITSIYCVKISILLFYLRIFFVTTGYKKISLVLMLFSTAWYIAAQIANLLTCQPIDAFWHRLKPGKCFNFNAMYLGTGIVDLFLDVAILVLPVRMACKLQLSTRTRVVVAGVFALGGFVMIAQIVRLAYVYQPGSKYVKFNEASRWTNIHDATAIICACLPLYKPLWSSVFEVVTKVVGRYANSIMSRIGGSRKKSEIDCTKMKRLGSSEVASEPDSELAESTHKLKSNYDVGQHDFIVTGGTGDDDGDGDGSTGYPYVPKDSLAYSRRVEIV